MIARRSLAPSMRGRTRDWLAAPALAGVTRGELLLYGLILVAAALLRFYDLGARTLHHDESIHAKESFDIIHGKAYNYDPAYHGPLLYFSNALLFLIVGAEDVVVRVLPALVGVGAVASLLIFRPELGRVGTPLAMASMTLSMAFLYYSRFARNDIYVALLTLIIVGALVRYAARPCVRWIYVAWIGLALSFAMKENTFIHGFLLVVVLLVFGLAATWSRLRPSARVSRSVRAMDAAATHLVRHGEHLAYGLLIFAGLTFLFYTTFLTNLQGFRDAFVESVSYWTGVHESERVNQPWFYYLMFMLVYEPFPLLIGAVALLRVNTARSPLPLVLAIWAVLGTAIYSAAGEKVPWLILHMLWPFLLLASWQVGRLLESRRSRLLRVIVAVLAALLLAWTVRFALPTNFERGESPVDFVVYVQSTTDVIETTRILDRAGVISGAGRDLRVIVYADYAWPFAWYLRRYPNVHYTAKIEADDLRDAAAVIVSPFQAAEFRGALSDHVARPMVLRAWFPEYAYKAWGPTFLFDFIGDPAARMNLWSWLWERRETPAPTGTFDYVLYVRAGLMDAVPVGEALP